MEKYVRTQPIQQKASGLYGIEMCGTQEHGKGEFVFHGTEEVVVQSSRSEELELSRQALEGVSGMIRGPGKVEPQHSAAS